MLITLIRHLPTEWNKKGLLQGKKDIPILPITETIQQDIRRNLVRLSKTPPPSIVLASMLKRTQQTAYYYGFQPVIDGLLDELDFGPFEGKTKRELIKITGETWFINPKATVLRQHIEELEMRIRLFLEKYKNCEHVLVFGHGAWIRALISYINTRDVTKMNQMKVLNNQMIQIEYVKRRMTIE